MYPYLQFVRQARSEGAFVATSLHDALGIVRTHQPPFVIKLLNEFDGKHRPAFLAFCGVVEPLGVWVICGEAPFLEAN